jgi:hypothetical protein
MPLMQCTKNGKTGWKWGEGGNCFIGTNAKQKAINQALAIGGGKMPKDLDDKNIDEDDKIQRAAKNAVNNALINGKIKKGNKCQKCNASSTNLEAHHHKGYDKKNHLNVMWVCKTCHGAIRSKSKDNEDDLNDIDIKDIIEEKNITFYFDAFDETKLFLTEKAEKTEEGFLKSRSIVTNTGIFNYLTNEGDISRQLRDTDQVMNPESLDTLKNIPITDGHPKELVTADNIEELQKKGIIVGFTGSNVRRDGHAVSVDMTITNKDIIDKIDSGEQRALSCGYKATTDFSQSGLAFGNNRYDAQQKDISYNHVAIVKQGRAGDLAQVRLDGDIANNIAIQYIEEIQTKEDTMNVKDSNINIVTTAIKIDGVDYNVERDVAKYINALETKNESIQKELSDAEGKRDAFQDEVEKLKKENKDLQDNQTTSNDEEINEAVKTRIELNKIADYLEIKMDENISNKDLKLLIIQKKNDKIDLKDKDETYLDAYFDSVKDILKSEMEKKNTNENKKNVFSTYVNKDENTNVKTKQQMYDEYKEKIVADSKNYNGAATIKNGQVTISN